MERPISHDKLLVTGACVRDELYDHVIPKMIVLMLFDNMTTKSSSHKLDYYKIDCNYFEYLYSEMEFVIQHYDFIEVVETNSETSTQACRWTDSLLKFIQQHRCCVDLESMRYDDRCWVSKHGLLKIPIVWYTKGSNGKDLHRAYIVANSTDINYTHVERRWF